MTQPSRKNAFLSEIAQKGPWLLSQVDLLNRLNKSVEKGGAIGERVVSFPRSVQAAAAVGLLSTSIAAITIPFPKSFTAPVIGAGAFFLTAALVPASEEEKRRKRDANLRIYVEDCENNMLLAEARGDQYLVSQYQNRIAEASRERLSLLVPDSTLSPVMLPSIQNVDAERGFLSAELDASPAEQRAEPRLEQS